MHSFIAWRYSSDIVKYTPILNFGKAGIAMSIFRASNNQHESSYRNRNALEKLQLLYATAHKRKMWCKIQLTNALWNPLDLPQRCNRTKFCSRGFRIWRFKYETHRGGKIGKLLKKGLLLLSLNIRPFTPESLTIRFLTLAHHRL